MKERPTGRQGDIRGMCQYPIALLSEAPPRSVPDAEITFGKGAQSWTLVGSARHGLPNPLDMEVYVALLTVTQRLGYPKENPFRRQELLDLMGWPKKSRYFDRLTLAFERWFELTIKERGVISWPEQPEGVPGERWVRLIDQVDWSDELEGPCRFFWHDHMLTVIRAHDFVHLNPTRYFSLRLPLSKAIYRFRCGRIFSAEKAYSEALIPFAQQRLGLLGQQYASQIERKLKPALDELSALGMGWSYATGRGGEKLIVFTPHKPAAAPQPPEKPLLTPKPSPEPLPRSAPAETPQERSARIVARELARRSR